MSASLSHPLPSLLSRTCRRHPRPSSNNPHRDLRCGPPPLATLNPPCLVGSQTAARTCGRKHSSASPLHGHGLLPRGLPETALEEWAPWLLPDPTQAREAHFFVCATIVDRHWRPAHGIPPSLSLDSLPTTILHQPPIPPSPTYNMTLCSYKADRPHDPILKSVLHSPPDMHHPVNLCCRHHGIHVFLFPSPPTPPHTESRAQHRRRARTGRPAAAREPLSVVPRPVSPDPKSSDGILCGCSIICSTVTIFAGASRRQSAARGEFPGGKHF